MSALLGAAATALAELDAASVGPFLVSRPIFLAPLVGWARGNAWAGAAVGVVLELATLAETPLGGRLDFSAPVAAGVGAWLAAGDLPREAALVAGLAAGWAHARAESLLRRGRSAAPRRIEEALARGAEPRLGAEISRALGLQAATTFAVAWVAIAAVGPALSRAWPLLPDFARVGAQQAFAAAPWIGAGGLAASLGRRA